MSGITSPGSTGDLTPPRPEDKKVDKRRSSQEKVKDENKNPKDISDTAAKVLKDIPPAPDPRENKSIEQQVSIASRKKGSTSTKAKSEPFKHSDPVEILGKIEEREIKTETREQKIEKFVATYLHPYITGKKTELDSEPMMTKLLRKLDPDNKLSDKEKKEIEHHAYTTYFKEAARGIYIREYRIRLEDETAKDLPSVPPPGPQMKLFDLDTEQFDSLVKALRISVQNDFPEHDLSDLTDDAAVALFEVNQEKARNLIEEGNRMISDQRALGPGGNYRITEKGERKIQWGERLNFELNNSNEISEIAEAPVQEVDARSQYLIKLIKNEIALGDTFLVSTEMENLLSNLTLRDLPDDTKSPEENYSDQLRDYLFEEGKKLADANPSNLELGIEKFVSLVELAKYTSHFKGMSDKNITLFVAEEIIKSI